MERIDGIARNLNRKLLRGDYRVIANRLKGQVCYETVRRVLNGLTLKPTHESELVLKETEKLLAERAQEKELVPA